jgi:hypothetical protein
MLVQTAASSPTQPAVKQSGSGTPTHELVGHQPAVKQFANTANIPLHNNPRNGGSVEWPPAPPYDHTVKELGNASNTAGCEVACIAYRNTAVSPVSGWTLCQSYTYIEATGRCIGVVSASEWAPMATSGATAGRVTWPPQKCATDADCGYNGVCSTHTSMCTCDVAWTGDRCQTLNLQPVLARCSLPLSHDPPPPQGL